MQKRSLILGSLAAVMAVGIAAPRLTRAQDAPPPQLTVKIESVRVGPDKPALAPALPRQLTVKIEWIRVGPDKPAPSREVEAITVLAAEGRTAQVTSATSVNGAVTKKTVQILPMVGADNIVSLDIQEETQQTDKSGKVVTNSTSTHVRIKAGDTRVLKGQISKRDAQTSETLVFVTPTLTPAAQ